MSYEPQSWVPRSNELRKYVPCEDSDGAVRECRERYEAKGWRYGGYVLSSGDELLYVSFYRVEQSGE